MSTLPPAPVLIDCDPGVDDAVALLLALASPEALDVRAITTVAGNVGLEHTTRNARIFAELAGRGNVPVFAGCERPMVRAPILADEFHGPEGLGDVTLCDPTRGAEPVHGVEAILQTLKAANSHTLDLIVTGPFTNVAMAMVLAPDVMRRVRRILVMGGARREGGNITASAEYNIYADPHAAHVVFTFGAPIIVFGLDATHQVRCTPQRIAAIRALGRRAGDITARLMDFSSKAEHQSTIAMGAPLHDPCPVAYALDPTLFDLRPCRLTVDLHEGVSFGHTDVEFRLAPNETTHIAWATDAKAEAIFSLLTERLGRL